mgnify:CR=1 FL=1|tara:strand:+ start:333 stop:608 length:276 start_codon:yes stop_codon:yes gene_type:complete
MDGLEEVSNMKFEPKFSIGNVITIGVLLFHLIFYSAQEIRGVEISINDVEENSEKIEQLNIENVEQRKDLEYIKKTLFRIEMMVTKIAEKE